MLTWRGDDFGVPSGHAAAETDGRVVANDLMTLDAHMRTMSALMVFISPGRPTRFA